MSDFLAGYLSGAAGILIGSPLDIVKVHQQAAGARAAFPTAASLLRGSAAPLASHGLLNALLFSAYNRALRLLAGEGEGEPPLAAVWAAGAVGGLATWVVGAPTELVKTRAQLAAASSSWAVARAVLRAAGVRGLFRGGSVTAARDAVGYAFYFYAYEATRAAGAGVLFAGGVAGCATWASVYPLDVVKTRIQRGEDPGWPLWKRIWAQHGMRGFWRGFGACMARAFVVNAVQWGTYEMAMREMGQGRARGEVRA